MKGQATLTGVVTQEVVAQDSKSEHKAIVLKTDDDLKIILRLNGANPFEGTPFFPFVGERVTVTGTLLNNGLMLKDMGDLKMAPRRSGTPPPPRP